MILFHRRQSPTALQRCVTPYEIISVNGVDDNECYFIDNSTHPQYVLYMYNIVRVLYICIYISL